MHNYLDLGEARNGRWWGKKNLETLQFPEVDKITDGNIPKEEKTKPINISAGERLRAQKIKKSRGTFQ